MRRIWNKIPDKIETAIVNLALEEAGIHWKPDTADWRTQPPPVEGSCHRSRARIARPM